jgi:DamX protein
MSCASSKLSLDMHDGKSEFKAGDYKQAFHHLLPVAVQGRAEAQYAVGYMYYYGYGVPQDNESGLFWMERSASQNFESARKALEMIRQNDMQEQKATAFRNQPDQRDEVLQSVRTPSIRAQAPIVVTPRRLQRTSDVVSENSKPNFTTEPVAPETAVAETKKVPDTKVATTDSVVQPRNFTLQLYGSYHLTDVKELQSQLKLKNTGHIYQTNHNGKDWYVLTFGNFETVHEASATKDNLPNGLKQMDPWVRKTSALKMV